MKSVAGSIKRKEVAKELQVERDRCDFDQKELFRNIFKDPAGREIFLKAHKDLNSTPEIANSHVIYEYTPEELQHRWMKKMNHMYFKLNKDFYFKDRPPVEYSWHWAHHGQPPIGLHYTMFTESVQNLASDEQVKEWMPKIQNADILGCYAQTELGHGSDVANLETTATFD